MILHFFTLPLFENINDLPLLHSALFHQKELPTIDFIDMNPKLWN